MMMKKTFVAVALRVASALLSLATVSLCIAAYDSEDSAFILLYMSFLNFGAIFVRLGLDVYLVKLASTTFRFRTRQLMAGTAALATVQCLALILPFGAVLRFSDVDVSGAAAMTLGLYFFSLLFVNGIFFQAVGMIGWMLISQSFTLYLPIIALILLRVPPETVPALHAASAAASFLLTALLLDRRVLTGGWGGLRQLRTVLSRFYLRSRELLVTSLANELSNWGILFLLPLVLAAAEFEIFAFAQRLSMAAIFLVGALEVVVSPRIAALSQQRRIGELRQLLFRVRLAAGASAAIGLVVVALALGAILQHLSLDYDRSWIAVYTHYVGRSLAAALGPSGLVLVMMGQYVYLRSITIFTSPGLIVATLAAGYVWGASGASLALMLLFLLQRSLYFRQSQRRLRTG